MTAESLTPVAPRRPSYSVAMATYNGGLFVDAQLRSIAEQTRSPAEVIVADDGSTDDTLAIVRRVASAFPCAISILEGESRLGPTGNLERALARVTSDVVFLSDQDDVWRPEKAATIMDRFERAPSVGGIFTDGGIMSDDVHLRSRSLWDTAGFGAEDRRAWGDDPLSVLLRHNVVTGASVALRSKLLKMLIPFPPGGWHDLSIGVLVTATSKLEACSEPLIDYRLHQANAAGLATGSRRSQILDRQAHLTNLDAQRQHWAALGDRMRAFGAPLAVLSRVDEKLDHLTQRRALPERRLGRVRPAIGEFLRGGYATYASGRWSLVRDVVGP